MHSIFNDSRLKLYRARQHSYEVSARWEEWVKAYSDPAVRREAKGIDGKGFPPYYIPIPFGVSLALGDCIRCLRSTLDYLVSSLARNARLPDNNIVFPFNEKRDGLEQSFRGAAESGAKKPRRAGALHELSREYPQLQTVILEDIQPYSADDGARPFGDLIWRIVTADNIDKHRIITPTATMSHLKDAKIRGRGGRYRMVDVAIINEGLDIPDAELEDDSDISFDILFEEPVRLAGKPVTSTLVEGCNIASEIINLFEAKFPRI